MLNTASARWGYSCLCSIRSILKIYYVVLLCGWACWRTTAAMAIDAKSIRVGETGLERLIQWLRSTNQPQTLEAITARYVAILRALVVEEEGR